MNNKRITFCTGFSARPVGGEKVIYELANKLQINGYSVCLIGDASMRLLATHLPQTVRIKICRFLVDKRKMPSWFKIDPRIECRVVDKLNEENFPDSDFVVATAVDTALPVANLSEKKGKKIYLIQGYENWNHSDDYVNNTYNLRMNNIVVSKWLKKKVDEVSNSNSVLIPNAIDTELFHPISKIEDRNKYTIGMLFHPDKHKGVSDAIKALDLVHDKYPMIRVISFGAPKRPSYLPAWYEYHRAVPYNRMVSIYNQCSIFVCASIKEGFGLTGAESMACGCALASTDYLGVHEYATDGKNSLLSPVSNPQELADNIIRLMENDKLRFSIAHEGVISIKQRNWDRFLTSFIKEIENE